MAKETGMQPTDHSTEIVCFAGRVKVRRMFGSTFNNGFIGEFGLLTRSRENLSAAAAELLDVPELDAARVYEVAVMPISEYERMNDAARAAKVQAQPDLHAQIGKALALAMTICDAVPTRAHLCDDSTLAHLGKLVNAQGDGAHGYAVIRDAEAAWKAVAKAQPVAGDKVRAALQLMVDYFGPCEAEYIFSKRIAIQKARAALAATQPAAASADELSDADIARAVNAGPNAVRRLISAANKPAAPAAGQVVRVVTSAATYENGPEGMPRVQRLPHAVLNCLIDHSLFRLIGGGLEGEDLDRLHGLMHDTAEEVLARVSLPAESAAQPVA